MAQLGWATEGIRQLAKAVSAAGASAEEYARAVREFAEAAKPMWEAARAQEELWLRGQPLRVQLLLRLHRRWPWLFPMTAAAKKAYEERLEAIERG